MFLGKQRTCGLLYYSYVPHTTRSVRDVEFLTVESTSDTYGKNLRVRPFRVAAAAATAAAAAAAAANKKHGWAFRFAALDLNERDIYEYKGSKTYREELLADLPLPWYHPRVPLFLFLFLLRLRRRLLLGLEVKDTAAGKGTAAAGKGGHETAARYGSEKTRRQENFTRATRVVPSKGGRQRRLVVCNGERNTPSQSTKTYEDEGFRPAELHTCAAAAPTPLDGNRESAFCVCQA